MRRRWVVPVAGVLVLGIAVFLILRGKRATPVAPPPVEAERVARQTDPNLYERDDRDEVVVPLPDGTGDVILLDSNVRLARRDTGEVILFDCENVLSRLDSAKRVKWFVKLHGYAGGVRPPHLLADAERIYLTHDDGVSALDAANGTILWHSRGPAHRMLISGDLLLATECGVGEEFKRVGRWLTARNVVTGLEVFQVRLPAEDSEPLPIEEVAGLFLVQRTDAPGGEGRAILLDRAGNTHCEIARQIVTVRSWAGGRLVLTGGEIIRLSSIGEVEWTIPFQDYQWLAGGDFVPLPGGGMAAFMYGRICDSGVWVMRFDPVRGGKVWETWCKSLGVSHSAYSHTASAEVNILCLRVTSRGSYDFVEFVDLTTGRSTHREVKKE